ncbi:MAG: PDZ domain-containing protein [Campylobacteraceae bacterium]|jgi:type II secretion system protein C|nr:PDZ domain-containing protein [Campylobacteraceae bacterium]
MSYRFNSKVLSLIFKILILLAIAKIIGLIIYIFLPKSGVNVPKNDNLADLGSYASVFTSREGAAITPLAPPVGDIKLMAVYKETKKIDGYAVVKSGSEVKILKTGDRLGQYRLKEIKLDGIFLDDNGMNFWVGFANSTLNTVNTGASSRFPLSPSGASLLERDMKLEEEALMAGQQNSEAYTNVIQRSELDNLLSNPDSVFKNIGFKEVMRNGKLEGFRVLSVNRNSPFAKLGLRAGDVITSFNGVKLDNYASVLEIYNNAKTYTRVKIEVTRGNEKKEFEYEIN